ncbi:DUF3093 domain-containing protein [Nocardioides sp. GY 10127]|uniref:DUF3093 domain-containing protein n=1 Tax=Nocardioides sp. GY 10127 TaxID=2569762 RepID=UPI0010A819F6|nr:DUF3093 domain-containing protein [Nocardioides sp. GY 10127]TIC86633.1 DUF3093 domain-containing protein [Nocardioides sp. GY 10127]
MTSTPSYSERLSVPLRWWVQATMMIATIWLAVAVAAPLWAAWLVALVCLAVIGLLFVGYGAARIEVVDGHLRAGPARLPLAYVGAVDALDPTRTRMVAGREADHRAYLLLRPYRKRAVRVEVTDPRDPAPYWLLSSRRPDELARALSAAVADSAAAAPRTDA